MILLAGGNRRSALFHLDQSGKGIPSDAGQIAPISVRSPRYVGRSRERIKLAFDKNSENRRNGDRKVESISAHIVDVSGRLFYRKGIRAVGIEEILREANVAKATLYRHFSASASASHAR